jgi:hypothetical protein
VGIHPRLMSETRARPDDSFNLPVDTPPPLKYLPARLTNQHRAGDGGFEQPLLK